MAATTVGGLTERTVGTRPASERVGTSLLADARPARRRRPSQITASTNDGTCALDHPLTWIRREHGWSYQDLVDLIAQRAGNMASRREKAWRWEHWGVVPDATTQELLADVLDVPREEVGRLGWPTWLPAGHVPAVGSPWTVEGGLTLMSDATGGAMLDRRGFLVLGAGVTASMARDWLASPTPPAFQDGQAERLATDGGRLHAEVVDAFEERLPALRRMDAALGGMSIRQLADAELRLVTDILSHAQYTELLGRRMFSVAAELGRMAGWASFDAGYEAAAERYWTAALRAAHLADDRSLGANVLKSMSLQAMDAARSKDAHDIARAAHEGVALGPARVQAMMTLRHARTLAGLGDATGTEHLLVKADRHMTAAESTAQHGEAPAWAGYFDQAEYAAQMASCYLLLNKHRESERWLNESLQTQPVARRRDRATYFLWQAESVLNLGEVEQACDLTTAAVVDILAARSARNKARLLRLNSRLQQYDTPAARDIDQYMREALVS